MNSLSLTRRLTGTLLGVIAPGLGHLFLGRPRSAIIIFTVAVSLILSVSWSRAVTTVYGLHILFAVLVIPLLYSIIATGLVNTSHSVIRHPLKTVTLIICFIALWWGILMGLFYYKQRLLGFEIYQIAATSMEPTLHHGDIILADTWAYADKEPTYGEIVLFTVYGKSEPVMVKRVAALAGDKVAYNRLRFLRYEHVASDTTEPTHEGTMAFTRSVVDTDHYFVVGDNLKASRDSRRFGAITQDNLIGQAVSVIFRGKDGLQLFPQGLK